MYTDDEKELYKNIVVKTLARGSDKRLGNIGLVEDLLRTYWVQRTRLRRQAGHLDHVPRLEVVYGRAPVR